MIFRSLFEGFKVAHQADLDLGTVLENSAAIYFDFNEPIITNTTDHQLAVDFPMVNQVEVVMDGVALEVYPNPFQTSFWVTLEGLDGFGQSVQFTLFNANGQMVQRKAFSPPGFSFQAQGMAQGLYFFKIETNEGELIGTGTLVKD